jgi:outer membrane receptor protein involved in Fe transport
MERRKWVRRRVVVALLAGLALVAGVGAALAGTTGKLTGRVMNQKKEPLTGVNVIIVGMPLGGVTDEEGRFSIINIPSGKIAVKAALIGHTPVTVQSVEINADNTTRLDVTLTEAALQMQEVVVSATRPVIETNRTSNIATVSREKLATLPVQELQEIVNLQAGVVDGHFRGGRIGEVQYQVDGVTVNNAYDNKSTLRLDRSLLEEVQVISGTFDAEYGQAMSGVVNAVLRRGGEKFHWDAEAYTGGPVYTSSAGRIVPSDPRPFSQVNLQASMSGPTGLPRTTFLLSGRHYTSNEWVRGTDLFRPYDRPDTLRSTSGADSIVSLAPTGTGDDVVLGYTREWSGVVKLSNRSIRNVSLDWQGILDVSDSQLSTWSYHVLPDGRKQQHNVSFVQGLDLTHTLAPTRFYTLSARQNYTDYTDYAFESVWDTRYDQYGAPVSYSQDIYDGAFTQGVDLDRFVQHTNGAVLKGSYVDQMTKERQLKVGAEWQTPHIEFGAPGYLQSYADSTSGGAEVIHRVTEYSPKFPGVVEYRPFIGAAFAQEEVEWNDLTLRGGLRFEYFDSRSYMPSDLANPANSIEGVPQSVPVRCSPKYSLAPRLGVSYPISEHASLFFAYGHFYQFPGMGEIFRNADYNQLADLQASSTSIPVMGNPDIRPERTVQYQFGYKHAITENLGLDVTSFYKDIRDLLGTKIIETYNGAQYAQLSNVDFGNVVGVTVTLNQRSKGAFSSTLDYTWQSAHGNSSDPNETANRAAAGEDARPRSIPFNWDQLHTLNLTLSMMRPGIYALSTIVRVASGQPYTPVLTTGFSGGLETNSGRKPASLVCDLRGERTLAVFGRGVRGFARVFNVFDTRFNNGFVFDSSGDPYYSRFPSKDKAMLNDPTRYYGPRRIELGLTLNVAQ